MKKAKRSSVAAVTSAVSWFSTTIADRDHREDQQVADERASCRHVGADAERGGDERRDREPEQARARLGRRVEPRREHREQRERPVGVVEVVRGAVVVGEEQQAERDLRRRAASARARATGRRPSPARARRAPERGGRRDDADPRSARNAFTWWAVSIARRNATGRTDVIEEGKPAPDFALQSDSRRDGHAVRPARQAGRPLLLSQGRHARLHDAGVRDPRRLRRVRAAPARSCSASRPTTRRRTSSSRRSTTCRSRCSPTRTTRSPSEYGVWGEKKYMGRTYMGVEPLDVRDRRGRHREEACMRDVKPATHADDVLAMLAELTLDERDGRSRRALARSRRRASRGASARGRRSAPAPRRCRRRRPARP